MQPPSPSKQDQHNPHNMPTVPDTPSTCPSPATNCSQGGSWVLMPKAQWEMAWRGRKTVDHKERVQGRMGEGTKGNECTVGARTIYCLGPRYLFIFFFLFYPLTMSSFFRMYTTRHHPHPLTTLTAMNHCSWGGGSPMSILTR
jgi:hypothetical protein